MKKGQNLHVSKLKSGKVEKRSAPVTVKRSRTHKSVLLRVSGPKYSDALIQIYNQEEEDINRFAEFAETLLQK